ALIAGASLIIDYILTVAVSIAAGTDAVTSALPYLSAHKVVISCFAVSILMFMNLRGVRESGTIFSIPTYAFIFLMYLLFILLSVVVLPAASMRSPSLMPTTLEGVGLWTVLVSFSSGCSALTGIEAISNGVQSFRKPESDNARTTLIWMGVILGTLF